MKKERVVENNPKLTNSLLAYFRNNGRHKITYSATMAPDPLLVFQMWIGESGDAPPDSKMLFKGFLDIVPKRDENFKIWTKKYADANQSRVSAADRKAVTKKRKAASAEEKQRKIKQKKEDMENAKQKMQADTLALRNLLRQGKPSEKDLAACNCKHRDYLKFDVTEEKQLMRPPRIKHPPKDLMAPEGYLVLNKNGTYQFDPPGKDWKVNMLSQAKNTCALMNFMATRDGVKTIEYQEQQGVYKVRSRVALAMWNIVDHGGSVCHDPRFHSRLFDMFAEESKSSWMPDLILEHSKAVFAYFHHYVVGAFTLELQSKLHNDLLKGIGDSVFTTDTKKYFKDIMKELYVTDAFCTGRYSYYHEARGMQLPWENP